AGRTAEAARRRGHRPRRAGHRRWSGNARAGSARRQWLGEFPLGAVSGPVGRAAGGFRGADVPAVEPFRRTLAEPIGPTKRFIGGGQGAVFARFLVSGSGHAFDRSPEFDRRSGAGRLALAGEGAAGEAYPPATLRSVDLKQVPLRRRM